MESLVTLNTESTVQRKDGQLLASEVGDELVMMDLESGNYISLNRMGHIIWQQTAQPVKVRDLLHYLTERFNVTEEQCAVDTFTYLNNMCQQNLLVVS